MDRVQRKRLGEILVEADVITEGQLQEALARKQSSGHRLGTVLTEMGLATEAQICQAIAGQQGIEVVDTSAVVPDPDALARVPAELAVKHRVVPLRVEGSRLILLMADPLDTAGMDAVWRAARCASVERVVAPESDVAALIQEAYAATGIAQQALKNLVPTETVAILADLSSVRQAPGTSDFDATEALNAIFGGAVPAGATHVHIEPTGRTINVRYRVGGRLTRVAVLPGPAMAPIIGRLRSLFQVDPNQHAVSQEGRARLQVGQHQVGLRLQLVPTIHGERAVVRILDPRRFQIRVEDLGFEPGDLGTLLDLLSLPQGIIVVAGPENAGTSTTLYSFLGRLREEANNLVTVEDMVDAILTGVTQTEVNQRMGITWPSAVRAAQRLDPDVLMVAEIPDPETASLVVRAAMSGQMVLAGMRAESAVAAVMVLLDMGVEPYLLASTLRGVVGQRLVRAVCPECKMPDEPDVRSLERLEITSSDLDGKQLVRGRGCRRCGATGYVGHNYLFELARVKGALRQCIAARSSSLEVMAAAREVGMRPLRDIALARVFAGQTTLSEAAAVVPAVE